MSISEMEFDSFGTDDGREHEPEWMPAQTAPPNTHVWALLASGHIQKMMYHDAEWLCDGTRTGIVPTHWRHL